MTIKNFKLSNKNNQHLSFTNVGASLMSWLVKDMYEKELDVVLGYNNAKDYLENEPSFGSIVGRNANRLAYGRLNIDNKTYQLEQNVGEHHLHGGINSFSSKIWDVLFFDEQKIVFSHKSIDGENGYPGNLKVEVTYVLNDSNELHIYYEATSDMDTICNLTNHSYFNLNGEGSGNVFSHEFLINANHFLPTDSGSIPTGVIQSVEGSIMDFRIPKKVKVTEFDKYQLFRHTRAYDHNYVLGCEREYKHAAQVNSVGSDLQLDCWTDKPGLQFYLSNFLEGQKSKRGQDYHPYDGFCLEAQFFPDALNHPHFLTSILKKGQVYKQHTCYRIQRTN